MRGVVRYDMDRLHNTNELKSQYLADVEAEDFFGYYEKLHPSLRRALQDAWFDYDTKLFYDIQQDHGLHEALRHLHWSDREIARNNPW